MSSSQQETVQWNEWSEEAFRKAKEQDKPILLDISAVWCHWCHVMDHTTYSNADVARIINSKFVPIRIDNDKRPDINRRYNMGGWPTTVFLTPDGRPITGGTYIPALQMIQILNEVGHYYRQNKAKIEKAESPTEATELAEKEPLSQQIVDDVVSVIVSSFDPAYGGFGDPPKFPHCDSISLALAQYYYTRDRGLLLIATKTLEKMSEGGVYDHEVGGFFRYSTTRDWNIPHFEKMSEDNAKLLTNYLEAFQLTNDPRFRRASEGIIDYVQSSLSDQEKGGFYGSQDADEEYYKLSKAERSHKKAPFIDRTLYANWNAMMASAYLLASMVLDQPSFANFAMKTLDRLLDKAFNKEDGICHYLQDDRPSLPGLLTDQAFMAKALLDAYQTIGDRRYLNKSIELSELMLKNLYDAEKGGFFDKKPEDNDLGILRKPDKPLDENSIAARVLIDLYHLTGEQRYFELARKTLEVFSSSFVHYGSMAAVYALAVDRALNPLTQVRVVGSREDPLRQDLAREALKVYNPRKTVQILDPVQDSDLIKLFGYPEEGQSKAYICVGQTCLPPISDTETLARELRKDAPSS